MLPITLSILSLLPIAIAAPSCNLKPSGTSNGSVAMGWFADWHTNFTVPNIPWKGYTHMAFFTAQPASNGTIEVILTDPTMPDQFTAAAVAHNVTPLITVGGWSGSLYWSSSVATAENRTKLANSIVQYCNQHGFKGIDFDWEYPNNLGIGCNVKSPQDSANYLTFLQQVRQLAPNLTLSAATSIKPFLDSSGSPLTNVSEYAKVLDWIEVMNYDTYGSFSSVTGPNSPLNDTCASTSNQAGSAVSAVEAWTNASFPANKIVLGVAAYSHSFTVPPSTAVTGNKLNIYTSFNKTNIPIGDAWAPPSTAPDECGNAPIGNGNSGIYNFWGLIEAGFLNSNGTVAEGMDSLFDQCSQTPFVYDSSKSILASYDDAHSFGIKGQFIKEQGLKGFAMYEVGGDHNSILIDAITQAMA